MQSVVEALGQRAARHPEQVALLCGDQRVSYGELWRRVVGAASFLWNCGVRPGERVMLAALSKPAFVYGYFATHLLGAVAVLIDPQAPASRRDELIRRTQPFLAFDVSTTNLPLAPCPSKSIDELGGLTALQCDFNPPALDALADLIFTTGTTGRPKGVRLTHQNLAAAVSHINAVIGTTTGDVEVVPIPLCHSFGLGRLRCVLSAGGAIVLGQELRLPGEIFAALTRHQATGLVGVPASFAVLLRFGDHGLSTFAHRLRYVEIGSAPMPLEHKRNLMELLPRTSLFMHYGLTEASRSTFIEFHRDRAHLESAGRPAPGVQVEVRDESGVSCTSGVLWIRGPHVSSGYWDDAELSAANFADGWMCSGDMAHIDADGFIHLHGRRDDIINVGGFKVSPDEVERMLADHPAVSDAACIGMPDPRAITGQVLRAYLVAADDRTRPSDTELSRWVAQYLEPHKIPAQFDWLSELPRTALGKLNRAALRDQAVSKT